jgi:hypothetical protein
MVDDPPLAELVELSGAVPVTFTPVTDRVALLMS